MKKISIILLLVMLMGCAKKPEPEPKTYIEKVLSITDDEVKNKTDEGKWMLVEVNGLKIHKVRVRPPSRLPSNSNV